MYSIGTDIVKINRIRKLSSNKKFLNKIFTIKEIKYCFSYTDPHKHLSGKYAGKEAVKKALLSNKTVNNIGLKDIEILNNKNKSPYAIVHSINDFKCSISISHDGDYAIAFALLAE